MHMAPARMITSEHTVARIGRRMKTSESTAYRPFPLAGAGAGVPTATGAPSRIFCTPETMSFSPGLRPDFTT